MPYPVDLVRPMKEELTQIGFRELLTPEDADTALGGKKPGTTLLVVNSVCGCAAGNARPGVALALEHGTRPDRLFTVFAGQDVEATARARAYIHGYPPSSPSIALFRDGELVMMMERKDIEGHSAMDVAQRLVQEFAGQAAG
ncbi:MAG TPA: BrxA/BrxB family bacilliredoxin [Candidatus Eisenbacteria bacterium]|nr:BrxA/BrxB family bacilliredoxin [Candidatus Eisenbacteria bacterium]